jgi:hypothetical protein
MFIQIEDPSDLPRPPEEVRIRSLDIDPYPDGRRLCVLLELTPFMEPPDLSLRVLDSEGGEVADLSIIGAHQNTLSLTVHLRGPISDGAFTFEAAILYEDLGQVTQFQREIELVRETGDDQA